MIEGHFSWVATMECLYFGRKCIGYVMGPDRAGPQCYEWGFDDDSRGGYASTKPDAMRALVSAARKAGYRQKAKR